MFPEVKQRFDFPAAERAVLEFWEREGIYQASLENRRTAPPFVFFEGPPTANGLPHPGHCLTRVIKDVFPRYQTMRGRRCERKAGWDTHGLPVEIEVGKELGIHSKQEIEAYGIEPFIHKCVQSVFRYTKEWEELTRRLGFWVNLEEAYVTYHVSYVESVWWALKVLFDQGLLYQGHKVVWWWAQGGTALSSGEVGEGYRDTDDPSITVRFEIKDRASRRRLGIDDTDSTRASFLAWTTTPWTLSSNVALAVGERFDYVLLEWQQGTERERFVLAESLIEKTFHGLKVDIQKDLKILGRFQGSQLVGLAYEPIFRYAEPGPLAGFEGSSKPRAWQVDAADFVTLDQGTGVVHVAPAFGEDDYRFAREKNFGFLQMVLPDGTFRPEANDVAGKFCKDADKEIIELLKKEKVLLKRDVYRHPYPFCPRAEDDPLIQYARESWFIRTTAFKEKFLENNAKIRWLPEHIREGRFGDFLRNNVDWAISRERYWGTPLPIWRCSETGKMEAVASLAELRAKPEVHGFDVWEKAKAADPSLCDDLVIHKPYIDAVSYASPFAAGARMERVSEVIDCWFDSGAMPFAQWGFPHQNAERFAKQFPADFISEAIDQTRGWFYSLLAISTMLQESLGPPAEEYPIPFRSCIVLGHLLGEDGKKMSKRLKNYREPSYILDRYGADALRWFFLSGQAPWNSIRFEEAGIEESQREFLIRLHNVHSFFVIYANIDGFAPARVARIASKDRPLLDRWILSELHQTIEQVTRSMDLLDNYPAASRLSEFVDALSNWYVRRSRERFWASGMDDDKRAAYWTLYDCLTTLARLLAPFTPFLAEGMFQNLERSWDPTAKKSIHLCDWPEADPSAIDLALSAEMELVREIVSVGRSARTLARLKVRQPLAAVEVLLADHRSDAIVERYRKLIAEELNVKKVELAERAADYVVFTAKANPKSLGPRHGKRLQAISQALAAADASAIRQALVEHGRYHLAVDGATIELLPEDVSIGLVARKGFAAAQGKRAVVVLTTDLTPELKQEGIARELIHAVQAMRKEADLAFDARIALGVEATGSVGEAALSHAAYIRQETLASEYSVGPIPSPSHTTNVEIEGIPVTLYLTPVEAPRTESDKG